MADKILGKGTTVDFQLCTDDFPADPTSRTNDLTTGGPWLTLGCTFDLQPPSCQWDSIEGEQCLEDADEPSQELGNIQEDNPSFTAPFDPGDTEYELLRTWCSGNDCVWWRFTYPNGEIHIFSGRIKSLVPDNVERDTFMRSVVTLLRTSLVYVNGEGALPTPDADSPPALWSCTTCREG